MALPERDAALRAALFARLDALADRSVDNTVRSADVNELEFEGRRFQVIGQQGIRRVAGSTRRCRSRRCSGAREPRGRTRTTSGRTG